MKELRRLFANNRAWAQRILAEDPEFFDQLAHQQAPQYFWIGCSDSRVPANQITGLLPGEMFVHRNVANVMPPGDLNSLATLQFAVEVLAVRHIILCGHYGCSGVRAALQNRKLGLTDQWLHHVVEVRDKHQAQLASIPDGTRRFDRLCELNVIEQLASVCQAESVRQAWASGQHLAVHGWIYAVDDGLLRDLSLCVTSPEELGPAVEAAIARQEPPPVPRQIS
jgi:carbonic anhydrase